MLLVVMMSKKKMQIFNVFSSSFLRNLFLPLSRMTLLIWRAYFWSRFLSKELAFGVELSEDQHHAAISRLRLPPRTGRARSFRAHFSTLAFEKAEQDE